MVEIGAGYSASLDRPIVSTITITTAAITISALRPQCALQRNGVEISAVDWSSVWNGLKELAVQV